MKNNIFGRTAAGILALSCIFTSASCSMRGGSRNNESKNADAEQLSDDKITNSYSSEDITLSDKLKNLNINNICKIGNTGKIMLQNMSGGSASDGTGVFISDSNFTDVKELEVPVEKPENGEISYTTAVTTGGNIIVVCTISDYGDMKAPDWDNPDFNYDDFDFDKFNENTKTSFKIIVMSPEGEVISNNDITCLEKYKDETGGGVIYFSNLLALGEDNVFFSCYSSNETKNIIFSTDGKTAEEIDIDGNNGINTGTNDADGNIIFTSWGNSSLEMKIIDKSTKKLSDENISLNDSDYYYSMTTGLGNYRCFMGDGIGLKGLKQDGTVEEVVNWINSDINGQNVRSIICTGEDEFIVCEYAYKTGKSSLSRLKKRDPSELENTEILTLAMMYDNADITSLVTEFNKSSDKYRVKVIDYSKYLEYDEENEKTLNSPDAQLRLDLVSGKEYDMICSYSPNMVTDLAPKGLFVDLYDFLGKDGTISKDEICANVIANNERDGKLYSLSPYFDVMTLAAKSKYYDKQGWTVDEFMKTYEGLPKGMKPFSDSSKEMLLENMLNGIKLVDEENNTCCFDSPDVLSMFEFVEKYGKEDEINWETATEDEMQKYWQEEDMANRNDKALFRTLYLSDPREYVRCEQGYFGDKITLAGFPGADGNGGVYTSYNYFSIMASSDNKDACWSFINTLFDEDYQESETMYNLPARKSSLEKKLDSCMEKSFYIDQDGKKQEYDDSVYLMDKEITIKPLTKEQRDFLLEYITGATCTGLDGGISTDISNIIMEEIEPFFNGEKTAKEVTDILQSRISIMLSEKS